jgi:CRP/FNR family transcriptional regulator, cyclic AMP receptor protein
MTGAFRTPEELLRAVDLFAGLSNRDVKKLVARGREVTHVKGKRVTGEGDPGYGFHLILSGRATVSQGSRTIRTLGEGDYFGEISMIDGRPRSATVTVDEDLRALAIDHGVFEALLDERPEVARGMLKNLCSRLREADARADSAATP